MRTAVPAKQALRGPRLFRLCRRWTRSDPAAKSRRRAEPA